MCVFANKMSFLYLYMLYTMISFIRNSLFSNTNSWGTFPGAKTEAQKMCDVCFSKILNFKGPAHVRMLELPESNRTFSGLLLEMSNSNLFMFIIWLGGYYWLCSHLTFDSAGFWRLHATLGIRPGWALCKESTFRLHSLCPAK